MTPEEKAIRQALSDFNAADGQSQEEDALDDLRVACKPKPMTVLLAELDSLRKDKARIDWLDREIDSPLSLCDGRYINLSEQGLREVIDTAMEDV